MDGDKYQFELYAVRASATTLKIDYTILPKQNDIDSLPSRFHLLVLKGMQMHVGTIHGLAYEKALQDAIAREQDLQGKRDTMGLDPVQASRKRYANNPS